LIFAVHAASLGLLPSPAQQERRGWLKSSPDAQESGVAEPIGFGENTLMSVAELPIAIDQDRVGEFCRQRGIRKLSFFGSVLREDFDPERSDVDVLAEFEPGVLARAGWNYFGYGEELGQVLGRKVDFCSRLHPLIQERVKDELLTIYERP
jgi:hypothetical protein